MTERERLIRIIENSKIMERCGCHYNDVERYINELSDHLLDNGVIVPPCNVGDTVYIDNRCILPEYINGYDRFSTCEVISIIKTRKQKLVKIAPINAQAKCSRYNLRVPISAFGKTIFLTRKEAEKALEEQSNG